MGEKDHNLVSDVDSDESGEGFYGLKSRPQRSRIAKKADKNPRSKRIKRSGPVGGLHQRRNKRINW